VESRSARSRLLAFIDESGQRSSSAASSDHFTMAAVAWHEDWDSDAGTLLRHIRSALGRQPSQEIHFVRLSHHDRLLAARMVGQACANLTIVTVTVCKRELPARQTFDDDMAYLWSLRLLLGRLSWLARDQGLDLEYTMAHIVRFKKAKLRAHEQKLRDQAECKVAWSNVPQGGSFDTPRSNDRLQLADIAASATFQAFEPRHGFVERRYLIELEPALYRRRGNLTSYGLKIVPTPQRSGTYGWALEM